MIPLKPVARALSASISDRVDIGFVRVERRMIRRLPKVEKVVGEGTGIIGDSGMSTRTPIRISRCLNCQWSHLHAGAVRSSLHRRCLFHTPSKVVSLQDGLLIWEIAMTGKANVKGLSSVVSGVSDSASSADTTPFDTSSPQRNSPKQTIRRPELRKIVPLADTTIY